ncbi:hypothetical protein KEM55_003261 [Ascosphaera atra]|nr:hypothetical protein KEM55_003261 [Ascosphaera atra]
MFRTAARPLATANAAARTFSTTSSRAYSRVHLIGNLGSEPELHATSSGREVVRYTVAVQNGTRDNKKTSWFKVSSFAEGGQKEYLLGLSKGSKVFVEGDISNRVIEDPQGNRITTTSIVQRTIEVLRRNLRNQQQGEQQQEGSQEQQQ